MGDDRATRARLIRWSSFAIGMLLLSAVVPQILVLERSYRRLNWLREDIEVVGKSGTIHEIGSDYTVIHVMDVGHDDIHDARIEAGWPMRSMWNESSLREAFAGHGFVRIHPWVADARFLRQLIPLTHVHLTGFLVNAIVYGIICFSGWHLMQWCWKRSKASSRKSEPDLA